LTAASIGLDSVGVEAPEPDTAIELGAAIHADDLDAVGRLIAAAPHLVNGPEITVRPVATRALTRGDAR